MTTIHNLRLLQKLRGVFQHECILNTFAYCKEATIYVPDEIKAEDPPRTGLVLATIAVCIIHILACMILIDISC